MKKPKIKPKIAESPRDTVMRNLEMKQLTDQQVRIINLNTTGKYKVHEVEYLNQILVQYRLPSQEEWLWRGHENNPSVINNQIYKKAYDIIASLCERESTIPYFTPKEQKQLEEQLKELPDVRSRAFLVLEASYSRPSNHPLRKAHESAESTFQLVRKGGLNLVTKYQNRTMTEIEYNFLKNKRIGEIIDEIIENSELEKSNF